MPDHLLNLQVSEPAKISYTSLGPEDRRRLDAWFDHLRNWRNDEFIRSRARRLASAEELYVFQTSTGLVIAFQIREETVVVRSIFREEALRPFELAAGRGS